ncbi:hypothetical protein KC887_07330 [Candidatus Kaiserbacteria bacterium]|nr:hypothetical protein [Candidatus Kaiserbacteria bacterium]
MEKLIEALNIFLKYGNPDYPTHCEHDVLYVVGYEPDDFSPDDLAELNELGFKWSDSDEAFTSFLYGSA